MVDVIVVYESIFGNTRVIAEAVADGVREADPDARVTVLRSAEATPDKIGNAALVVAGGPTHMGGMSKAPVRQKVLRAANAAAGSGNPAGAGPEASGPGVREWLDTLPRQPRGHKAAAFDTRYPFPLAGGAARAIARGLRRHGYDVVARPAGFVVDGAQGPLRAGERDRARAWGAGLARQLASQPAR